RVCVIAGPGCGKTKTLVSRLIYLLSSQKAQPRNILTLTFVLDSLLTYTEKLHLPLQVKIENLTRTNSFY
ncbi:MAG: UvrD-helicase domain-containing protein, partial [Spiroplasmataceae bacterium]|nr:UvrD-helicase domain-containing protein [Spiroplasmataceae bacterium]